MHKSACRTNGVPPAGQSGRLGSWSVPQNFLFPQRDQPLLLPVDMREWLPEDDLVYVVLDAVATLDLGAFYAWYPTIARFRARHEKALGGLFSQVLRLLAAEGMVCLGTLSLDGTKLADNAAQKANKTLPQIEKLLAEAAAADAAEDAQHGEAGPVTPRALARRAERRQRLAAARDRLAAQDKARREAQRAKQVPMRLHRVAKRMAARLRRAQPAEATPAPRTELTAPGHINRRHSRSPNRPAHHLHNKVPKPGPYGFVRQAEMCTVAVNDHYGIKFGRLAIMVGERPAPAGTRLPARSRAIHLDRLNGTGRTFSCSRCEVEVELDLDLVAELERSKKGRIGTDPPLGLDDNCRPMRPARAQLALNSDRPGDTHDGQVTIDAKRLCRPMDPARCERDRRVLPGVQDLATKRALDVGAVSVGQRLDAARSLPHLERVDVDLNRHRRAGRAGGIDNHVRAPAGHLDGQIVTSLGTQSGTGCLDQQPARCRSHQIAAIDRAHHASLACGATGEPGIRQPPTGRDVGSGDPLKTASVRPRGLLRWRHVTDR
jgi:hypothetical protein